ncbi:MAG: hypothetical protein K8S25_04530 [Alphaproteobacteria bacterium]|nr:hypothetical protein [Alphaproteobacteria bacterium]
MHTWATSTVRGRVTEVTVLTPIKRGFVPGEYRTYEERLRSLLASLNERANNNVPTPISAIATIHFARWFIVRPEQYLRYSSVAGVAYEPSGPLPPDPTATPATLPRSFPAEYDPDHRLSEAGADPTILPTWLVFTSNYDGDLKAYIRMFSERIAGEMDRIWSNCESYPTSGARDFEKFWLYVRAHQIETNAFFAAYPNMSTARVNQLRVFKDHFDAFVSRTRGPDGRSIGDIGALFDEFIAEQREYTKDFPGEGGLYDDEQSERIAETKKWRRKT